MARRADRVKERWSRRTYRARRSMPDRRFPGRRRSMPVRRSCSGPPGGPRSCWRLSGPRASVVARPSVAPPAAFTRGRWAVGPGRTRLSWSGRVCLAWLAVLVWRPVHASLPPVRVMLRGSALGSTLSAGEDVIATLQELQYRSGRSGQVVRPRSPTRRETAPSRSRVAGVAGRTKACGRLERPSPRSVAAASPFSTPRLWVPLPASRP